MKRSTELSLIAEWSLGKEFIPHRPDRVYWADGTPATYEDYVAHHDSTYILEHRGNWMVENVFPWLTVVVQYDNTVGRWRVSGHKVESFYLGLTDPTAANDQITAEMSTYRVVYKHRILRG